MDKREILRTKDRTKVEKVIFKHPELISEQAEQLVKDDYYNLLALESQLQESREEVRRLEKLYNEKKAEFASKSSMFELEFAVVEKEHITHENHVMFKGMGNDIIGRPRVS